MNALIKKFFVGIIFSCLVGSFVIGVTVRIVPTPFIYPTIQSAIDASSDSDIVLVIPAYTGSGEVFPITVNGKNIFIKGVASEFDTVPRMGLITVRGRTGQSVFKYTNVSYGLLAGFTLTGGKTGVECENSSFVIAQNLITANHGLKGAGIFIKQSSAPIVTLNKIENNTADSSGGGIYIEPLSSALISLDTIRNNTAIYGGGIYVSSGLAEISGNVIELNRAQKGAGVFFDLSAAIFTNNRISSNNASVAGGGVYITNGSNPIFTADTFSANSAPKGAGVFVNAFEDTLISITPPLFTIRNVYFNSDHARVAGGGIFISRRVVSVIWDCFFDNTLSDSIGGGIYLERPDSLFVTNSAFYRTKASQGGGGIFALQASNCFFKNSVFHTDSARIGGAMYLYFVTPPSVPPVIADNIFDDSNMPSNSMIYSNLNRVSFEYNRVPGSGAVVGFPLSLTNATGDPRFSYLSPYRFRLKLDSPCIDTGEPDTLYRDDDLGRCDMGIYGGPGALNPPRPRRVERLSLVADSSGVRLFWTPVAYPAVISYAIYRSTSPGFLPVELDGRSNKLDTTSQTTYLDPVIIGPGNIFCYRVNAFIKDTLVAGGYSNEACTAPLSVQEPYQRLSPFVKVFPNPFNSTLKVEISTATELEIYDAVGRLVEKIDKHKMFWKPSGSVPAGLYFVKACYDKGCIVEKVIYIR